MAYPGSKLTPHPRPGQCRRRSPRSESVLLGTSTRSGPGRPRGVPGTAPGKQEGSDSATRTSVPDLVRAPGRRHPTVWRDSRATARAAPTAGLSPGRGNQGQRPVREPRARRGPVGGARLPPVHQPRPQIRSALATLGTPPQPKRGRAPVKARSARQPGRVEAEQVRDTRSGRSAGAVRVLEDDEASRHTSGRSSPGVTSWGHRVNAAQRERLRRGNSAGVIVVEIAEELYYEAGVRSQAEGTRSR